MWPAEAPPVSSVRDNGEVCLIESAECRSRSKVTPVPTPPARQVIGPTGSTLRITAAAEVSTLTFSGADSASERSDAPPQRGAEVSLEQLITV